jgi:glutathione S-transferase
MKLYYDPASTVCRGILLFVAEHGIELEPEYINLFAEQQMETAYGRVNPNRTVPTLVDDTLCLTESSAILKYLADQVGSAAYPAGLRDRARVNAAMDWFNTGFYHAYGYILVYSRMMPHKYGLSDAASQAEMEAKGLEKVRHRLGVLNDHMIGDNDFVCGPNITLADYFGLPVLTLGELVDFDLSPWPNVQRWVANMKSRPGWAPVDVAFQGMKAAFAAQMSAQAA